jgi:nitroreductase
MDAIEALHNRVSSPLLNEPAPTPEQVQIMLKAAIRAPDHKMLKPWRFLIIEGQGRERFGDLLARAAKKKDPQVDEEALTKARNKPLRAPMIIVSIACLSDHPKVPQVEQIITAGAAANNIVTAAFALGLGAYWRTGSPTYDEFVKEGLGLTQNEEIIGFIYLGTANCRSRRLFETDVSECSRYWLG